EVRALVIREGLDVVQCLSFGALEVLAGGLHLDQCGAGDEGVDVAALPGRRALSSPLVHRRGGSSDAKDLEKVPHKALSLASFIPFSVAPLRYEGPGAGAYICQHEGLLAHGYMIPGERTCRSVLRRWCR